MSRNKKSDDDIQSPADWVARHGRVRVARLPPVRPVDEMQIRRRSEREAFMSRDEQTSRTEKPLIDRIDNAWQRDKQSPHHDEYDPIATLCDPDDENSCPNVTARMARSRRWRRVFLILLVLFGSLCYYWYNTIWPMLEYDFALKIGFLKQPRGTYGLAMGGDYEFAKVKIAQLDSSLLPGGTEDQHGKRRLVFVGDIHGCKDKLLELLQKIDFDEKRDHLIATGDMISKGPDSPGVIEELIRLKASAVRGNHEDRLLTMAAVQTDKFGQPAKLGKAAQTTSTLLKQLKPHHLHYLRNLPLILRIPPLPLATSKKHSIHSEVLVVHAGLVPAVPLNKQDPYFVMNMRSMQKASHVPSERSADKEAHLLPWSEYWNWFNTRLSNGRVFTGWHPVEQGLELAEQPGWVGAIIGMFTGHRRQPKPKPQVVVYGHDSRAGLVKRRWSIGLDTGCVRGGKLTCLILDALGQERLESVDCSNNDQ